MIRRLFPCLLLAGALSTFAAEVPHPSVYDERIVEADYFDKQVYRLTVFFGMHMQIVFEPGERIDKSRVKFGDKEAWDFDVIENRLLIKATGENPETNLSVFTSRRDYEFVLEAKTPQNIDDKSAHLKLIFNYPHESYTKRLQRDASDLAEAMKRLDESARKFNMEYVWQGSGELKPLEVKDDGERTYFKFAPRKEMPAIYAVGPDGTEMPVNYSTDGDYVVVHRLAARFAIRYGQLVTCIKNLSYEGIAAASMQKESQK